MSIRIRLAAGLLLAVMTSGAAVGTASAADTSPASGTAAVGAEQKSGHREGPFSTVDECSDRAWVWTDKTGLFHFCKYRDGSGSLAEGYWVWEYN